MLVIGELGIAPTSTGSVAEKVLSPKQLSMKMLQERQATAKVPVVTSLASKGGMPASLVVAIKDKNALPALPQPTKIEAPSVKMSVLPTSLKTEVENKLKEPELVESTTKIIKNAMRPTQKWYESWKILTGIGGGLITTGIIARGLIRRHRGQGFFGLEALSAKSEFRFKSMFKDKNRSYAAMKTCFGVIPVDVAFKIRTAPSALEMAKRFKEFLFSKKAEHFFNCCDEYLEGGYISDKSEFWNEIDMDQFFKALERKNASEKLFQEYMRTRMAMTDKLISSRGSRFEGLDAAVTCKSKACEKNMARLSQMLDMDDEENE